MSTSSTPAEMLIETLGLTRRFTAEVRDLYSQPIGAGVLLFRRRRKGLMPPEVEAA